MGFKLQYVRTDRNGTKYYNDWTCPRCGGAGESAKWMFTGSICYGCGGTGKRAHPKVVKEYTEEYAAKLEAKRNARQQKKMDEAKQWAEEHASEIEEQNRRIVEQRFAEHGCGSDGIGYVLEGNTYKIKDQIKANGGRWIYGVWVCPVEMKCIGVTTRKIDINGHVGSGSLYWLDDFDFYEAVRGR